MPFFKRLRDYLRLFQVGIELMKLPKVQLHFYSNISPEKIRAIHALYTQRHPRFLLIKNKTMGIALIDLRNFNCPAAYLDTVKKKDCAEYHSKIARRRGYTTRPIDRNAHVDAIYAINHSAAERQGRPMDPEYQVRQTHYEEGPPFLCYGVFNSEGTLVAYCNIGIFGNFASTDRLLGLKNNDGTMYLLLAEIICSLIREGKVHYFMYDTFLGAQPGLKNFKRRVGFAPYRVRYVLH